MRTMQQSSDIRLPEKSYIILQLDGKAFHTWTKGLALPFDESFVEAMNNVAMALVSNISNVKFAYVQSDEISLVMTDLGSDKTQTYHGNRVQKIVSTSAGLASAVMTRCFPNKNYAIFDARMFVAPSMEAVNDWFTWRQADAVKNSVRAVGYSQFSAKQLMHKNTQVVKQMLQDCGIPWELYDLGLRQGRIVTRHEVEKTVTFTHRKTKIVETKTFMTQEWFAEAAPIFNETSFVASQLSF